MFYQDKLIKWSKESIKSLLGSNQYNIQYQVRQVLYSNIVLLKHVTFVNKQAILLQIDLLPRKN